MRYLFTMNMPSFSGNSVHQIIGDHPATSLDELADALNINDFVTVTEVYKEAGQKLQVSEYYLKGPIILNCMHIGKVKEFIA
jgi:hypothetical protein